MDLITTPSLARYETPSYAGTCPISSLICKSKLRSLSSPGPDPQCRDNCKLVRIFSKECIKLISPGGYCLVQLAQRTQSMTLPRILGLFKLCPFLVALAQVVLSFQVPLE